MSVELFGRVVTAMVTPFDQEHNLDRSGAARLASWLTAPGRSDGIVVNGTTGESPTTTDAEKRALIEAVREAAPAHIRVTAGVGTNDTAHSIKLARDAARAGADALLVVTPYYSKPTQAGILDHLRRVADSTPLPVMLYDIPGRSGVALSTQTIVEAGRHDRIVAVKDAKGDVAASSEVMRQCDLAYFSGDDVLALPLASVGARGVVSVAAHLVPELFHVILEAVESGSHATALESHRRLLPLCDALMAAPAAASVKALLDGLDLPSGPVRPPLCELTADERRTLQAAYAARPVDVAVG